MAEIRPMRFGEILDGSLKLYIHNFGLFLPLAIASLSVPAALFLYFMFNKGPEFLAMAPMMMQGIVDWSTIGFLFVIGFVYMLGSMMLQAGAIRVVSDSYLGRTTTFGQAIALGASKIFPLFLVSLAKGILMVLLGGLVGAACLVAVAVIGTGGGLLAALAIGLVGGVLVVWVAAGYGVTTPVVVLEQLRSFFDAFGRSWDLTKGSRARIVGLAIVAGLLFNVVPNGILSFVSDEVMKSSPAGGMTLKILSYVIVVLLYPALSCVFTLIYYDLRVRREAFDLQVLSQQLGA